MTALDPATIAARLDDAEKRALLWLPQDGGFRNPLEDTLDADADEAFDRMQDLVYFGEGSYGACLSPLGQQVRAHLQQEATDAQRKGGG